VLTRKLTTELLDLDAEVPESKKVTDFLKGIQDDVLTVVLRPWIRLDIQYHTYVMTAHRYVQYFQSRKLLSGKGW
jgi:hypothetical protein